jgi:ribosomal protein S18 acetylase RimI-like enzyme
MAGVRALGGGLGALAPCFVLPGARNAGLGRRLVSHACEAAQRRGFTRLELETVPEHLPHAFVLYRSLGFAVVGRRQVPGLAADVVAMSVELAAGPTPRG